VRFKVIVGLAVALVIVGLGLALVLGLALSGGGDSQAEGGSAVLLAAGDIAECDHEGDEATAKVLADYPQATIQTLGDNAYQHGTAEEFEQCYDPTWGQFKDRTMPATGNHDEATKNAQGYWDYFGESGGPYDKYYYSYDLGAWHVVVLNSDCWRVGGCETDDPQAEWLRTDLAGHSAFCTLAVWHRPPFSSGRYGDPEDTARVRPLWGVINEEGVDVLLTGHEHSYERFAPMDTEGKRDEAHGVRLFVVGTGGGNLRSFANDPLPTTEAREDDSWGVLKLDLKPSGYDWDFLPVEGSTFSDSGTGNCH
jgi:acid phosphatase type 7